MSELQYPFPLAIQTILPEDYRETSFRAKLELLQQFGFSGIELNMSRPEQVDPLDLKALLADHGLKMTMFASGATANAEGLSLSHEDERVRAASNQRCIEFLDLAAEYEAGVIAGFLKGPASADRSRARALFRDSLVQLEPHVRERQVPLLIEATNHYESSVANSLAEAAGFFDGFENPFLRILPDTYHMNIEECSMFGALVKYSDLYQSVHISDNNRFFPGLGAIDFYAILRFLKENRLCGRRGHRGQSPRWL